MMNMKTISGFYLGLWVPKLNAEKRKQVFDYIARDFKEGGKIFGTKKPKTMELSEWKNIMEESKKVSDQGKILMKVQ